MGWVDAASASDTSDRRGPERPDEAPDRPETAGEPGGRPGRGEAERDEGAGPSGAGSAREAAPGQAAPGGEAPGPSGPDDDRLRILRMVQQGRVTPEQAVKLLDALAPPPPPPPPPPPRPPGGPGPRPGGGPFVGASVSVQPPKGRTLRIRVREEGEDRVQLAIPLGLARSALRLIPARAQRHLAGVDLEALLEQIEQGASGRILVIQDDDESGVEVSVE